MTHWFDRLAKLLASGHLSRRDIFRWTFRAGLAAASAKFSGDAHALAQVFPRNRLHLGDTCTITNEGSRFTHKLTVSSLFKGKRLSLSQTIITDLANLHGGKTPSGKINKSAILYITIGEEQLLNSKYDLIHRLEDNNNPQIVINSQYGNSIRGLKNSQIIINNRFVEGTLDGRSILPFAVEQRAPSRGSIRFRDNRPAPKVEIDPELSRAIQALLDKVKTVVSNCQPQKLKSTSFLQGELRLPISEAELNTYGWIDASYQTDVPDSYSALDSSKPQYLAQNFVDQSSPSCRGCLDACFTTNLICTTAIIGTGFLCIIFPISCPSVAAAIACETGAAACYAGCYIPSIGGCCPISCGSLGFLQGKCCGEKETCVNSFQYLDREYGCCPEGQTVCNNVCCSPGVTACLSNGTCGCTPNLKNCGNNCCKPTETCCAGDCCGPSDVCLPQGCCQSPRHACGSNCCPPFNICCNGVCCGLNQQCINGQCQTAPCPPGQVPCPVTPGQCCPPNYTCCAYNTCCPPGYQCCGSRGCINTTCIF